MFGTNHLGLSVTISEIFTGEYDAMVDMTFHSPNKGQRHSFWYQMISYMRLLIGCQ